MIGLYVILGSYVLMLLYFAWGFLKIKPYYHFQNNKHCGVSIIICARNEEKHIQHCLYSILHQDYPRELIEIIFIDDASSDNTLGLATQILNEHKLRHQLLCNKTQLGKKQSLAQAIQKANHEFIITRDADTYTQSELWLSYMAAFYFDKQSDFIIAPVALQNNTGLLWALQAIENNVLAVFTGGSHHFKQSFLCNGANLAFTKTIYTRCQGYASHINIASGDDVLFLEDVKKINKDGISYLFAESALVYTYAQRSFSSLLHQKVRWASKFKNNPNKLNTFIAVLVFITNLIWLIHFFGGFIPYVSKEQSLLFILIKIAVDFLILLVASKLIKNKHLLWYSLPVGFIYPLYTCIVALASLFLKPKWKT